MESGYGDWKLESKNGHKNFDWWMTRHVWYASFGPPDWLTSHPKSNFIFLPKIFIFWPKLNPGVYLGHWITDWVLLKRGIIITDMLFCGKHLHLDKLLFYYYYHTHELNGKLRNEAFQIKVRFWFDQNLYTLPRSLNRNQLKLCVCVWHVCVACLSEWCACSIALSYVGK